MTPVHHITVASPIEETSRVLQVRGIFDLPAARVSAVTWDVHLPLDERPWHLGLIVGPSGCGKTTIARHLWPGAAEPFTWPERQSVLDAFPAEMPVKEVIELLSSVGFSSPPAWLRPYHVLSTGQQFRAALARLLACPPMPGPVVVDEYTSVVDRTAAQVGSAALARTVRRRGQQFVAVTCHEDVEPWLQPDWTYRPAEDLFQWRCLRRRPAVVLDVVRCAASAWPLFAHHHYLSGELHRGAVCFLASWKDRPVAFSAWLHHPGTGPPTKREHRTVTLPDYQGLGIGNRLSAFVAGLWRALGFRAVSTTTHPAMIASRRRSPLWRMHRAPSMASASGRWRHASTRLTAGFTYVGPPLPRQLAATLLETTDARRAARLTAQLVGELAERIKAGAFEEVAAESLGVPLLLYESWLARGRVKGARGLCLRLVQAVQQAKAHARLMAEMDLRKEAPKVWLLSGPGKESAEQPGWTAPARPRPEPEQQLNVLEHPEFVALLNLIKEVLEPYPEARDVLLRAITGMAPPGTT